MTNDELKSRATQWWADLDSGERAALRRCQEPIEALTQPSVFSLMRRLGGQGERAEKVAAIACVLAHVKEDDARPFAKAIGRSRFGKEDARVSEARFRRLLTTHETDELQTELTRIVCHIGGKASVADLTTSILYWSERRRAAWARDYYAATTPDDDCTTETETEMETSNV